MAHGAFSVARYHYIIIFVRLQNHTHLIIFLVFIIMLTSTYKIFSGI